ncbi:MAG: tetratricopeptide repeat protein [Amylibacter sp.]|nr:tetratricopeptide repeat protein [Amylibacter sp.]
MDVIELTNNAKKEIKKIKNEYKVHGSTYGLMVKQTHLIFDITKIVEKSLDTEHHAKSIKLENRERKFYDKLRDEISLDDLRVLAKHGITDAHWLIGKYTIDNLPDDYLELSDEALKPIIDECIYHLECGVIVDKIKNSTANRMLYLAGILNNDLVKDYEKTASYLKQATEIGNDAQIAQANFLLWNLYLTDIGNKTLAKKYLLQAVKYNHPEAVTAYARAHFGNWLVEEDWDKAFKLLQKAHILGDKWGTELLAQCFAWGDGTKENPSKAFKLRLELTEDYSIENCGDLGLHYLDGDGVLKDTDEGLRLVKKAMKLGNGKSYYDMSNYLVSLTHEDHLSKTDVKKIKKKRFNILKKSMELEEPFTLALLKLADCYLYGNGTKQNFKKAQEIYLLIRDSDQSLSNHIAVAQIKLDALNHDDPLKALDEYIDDFESELDDDDPLKILSDLLDEEEDGA